MRSIIGYFQSLWLLLIVVILLLKGINAIDLDNIPEQDCIIYIEWKTNTNIDVNFNIPSDIEKVLDVIANEYFNTLSVEIKYTDYHPYSKLETTTTNKTGINTGSEQTNQVIKRGFATAKVLDLYNHLNVKPNTETASSTHKRGIEDDQNSSGTIPKKRNTIEEMRNKAVSISKLIEDNMDSIFSNNANTGSIIEEEEKENNTSTTEFTGAKRDILKYRGYHKGHNARRPTPPHAEKEEIKNDDDNNQSPPTSPVSSPSYPPPTSPVSSPHPTADVYGEPVEHTQPSPPISSPVKEVGGIIVNTPRLKIFIDENVPFTTSIKAKATFGWNLDRINQANLPLDSSWTLPSAYSSIPGSTAADLAWIYIVDTGILSTHVELTPRVAVVHNGFPSSPLGCHKHATHVASIAAGKDVGVNPRAKIFDVRVLDCSGSGTLSTVLQGIMAINNHCTLNGGKGHRSIVINMSIGGGGNPNTGDGLALANELAISRNECDAVIVAAAGNEHGQTCNSLPAALVNPNQGRVMSISATAINDGFASFSNYGTCTILNAPGVNINGATNSGNAMYETLSGTSMASPLVAGVASVHTMLRPTNWNTIHPSNLFADVIYSKIVSDAAVVINSAPSGTTKKLVRLTSTAITPDPFTSPIAPIGSSPSASSALKYNNNNNNNNIFIILAILILSFIFVK